jgi:porphobilinogen synthase
MTDLKDVDMVNERLSALTPTKMNVRPRRLRHTTALRELVRETELNPADLIYPLFITHGSDVELPVPSMPGVSQLSVDRAVREAREVAERGVRAIILFGLPASKDPVGLENFASDGIIQRATRAIKEQVPNLVIVTDVCLCE